MIADMTCPPKTDPYLEFGLAYSQTNYIFMITLYDYFNKVNKFIALIRCLRFNKNGGDPPVMLDVGARGGMTQPWRWLAKLGLVKIIGFEPDVNEAKRLNEKYPFIKVLPIALGNEEKEVPFYITESPHCASCLRPNYELLNRYRLNNDFIITRTINIQTRSIDNLIQEGILSPPNYIKIDVQGLEYKILKGAEKALANSIVGIELETHLKQIYSGENIFYDIVTYLDKFNFFLCEFRPQGEKKFGGEIVEANCFFIKEPLI